VSIEVIQKVTVYEVNEEEAPDGTEITVSSHPGSERLVVLCLKGGESLAILSRDLLKAIENAVNV